MANFDIGIDLGTYSIIININGKLVLNEPAVIAVNTNNDEVIAVGERAYDMIGKTPSNIIAARPIVNGVVSDYKLNDLMIQEFLKRVSNAMLVKPRVIVCVHALITDVERRAVVDAAVAAGARKVYLIEEPIATALGIGMDIKQPNGQMIVNIGGGSTDVAVISMNGIVVSNAARVGGSNFDADIVKYVLNNYKLHVGERMAELVKKAIGVALNPQDNRFTQIKGRNGISGLPQMINISQTEIYEAIKENLSNIIETIRSVLEITPPELIGDVHTNGIILAGGGSLLKGIDELIKTETGISTTIAEEPITCVSKGASKAFDIIEDFQDGFFNVAPYKH